MQLHNIAKIVTEKRRRLGQGHGSGRGKTGGRGTKGTHARNKVSLSFEGGALPLIKRLPFRRGKGKNKSFKPTPSILTLNALSLLPAKTVVTLDSLIEHKVITKEQARVGGVKILSTGEMKHALTVQVPVSKSAAQKIEQAGGKVELTQ